MSFDIPRNVMLHIDQIDVRLDHHQHPFERQYAAEIAENWQAEVATNPALFNGRVLLHTSLGLVGKRLVGACNEVDYSTLMYWRRNRSSMAAEHAFANSVLISKDNALIVIRMGKHTASPNLVTFAAGSFEAEDLVDGRVDVDANMIREVREETGILLSSSQRESGYLLFSNNGATAIMRRYWLDDTAENVAQMIDAFVATEKDPEITGSVVLRSVSDLPSKSSVHLAAYARWHFGQGAAVSSV